MKNKKLKGFTLIEFIVVLAIIGVILGILVPNWIYMVQKNRVQDQNARARVVYNAAQTIIQEYRFEERHDINAANSDPSKIDATKSVTPGEMEFIWDCKLKTMTLCNGVYNGTSVTKDTAFANELARKINNIFAGEAETTYRVYVNNYIVEAVICRSGNNDKYLGAYPDKFDEPNRSVDTLETVALNNHNHDQSDNT